MRIKNNAYSFAFIISGFAAANLQAAPYADLTLSDQDLVKSLAPVIYFHPDEQAFPVSYDYFIQNSDLKDSSGNIIDSSLSGVDALIATGFTSDAYYLDLDDNKREGNLSGAPIYASIKTEDGYKKITFWAFYGYNDCQIFRGKFYNSSKSKKRNFEWCRFGRHEADTERLTYYVDASSGEITNVGLYPHGKETLYAASSLTWTDSNRVNVYVAMNTHGFYASRKMENTGTIIASDDEWIFALLGVNMSWLKTVDITTTSDLVGFNNTSYTKWDTATATAGVELISAGDAITQLEVKWGEVLDNTSVQNPTGDLPYVSDSLLQALGELAMDMGLLADYEVGKNGKGAWLKEWF